MAGPLRFDWFGFEMHDRYVMKCSRGGRLVS